MIPERAGTAGGINAAHCAFEKAFGRRTGQVSDVDQLLLWLYNISILSAFCCHNAKSVIDISHQNVFCDEKEGDITEANMDNQMNLKCGKCRVPAAEGGNHAERNERGAKAAGGGTSGQAGGSKKKAFCSADAA